MSVALLLLLASPAWAFHAYPKGGPHDRVTRRAAESAELHPSAVADLKQAVREVDLAEMAIDLRASGSARLVGKNDALLQPRCNFDGSHHFQRRPDEEVEAVLREGRSVLKRARVEAVSALEDGDRDQAIEELGHGLHVLQDFFANSNVVLLDEATAPAMVDWLVGEGELPPGLGLQLVVYSPCADVPGEGELPTTLDDAASTCTKGSFSAFCMSVGSPKSHGGSQRDAAGHRAFDRAVGYATDASVRWMEMVQLEAGQTWSVLQ